jgi:phosphate starvation-inducible PhoH-like protein
MGKKKEKQVSSEPLKPDPLAYRLNGTCKNEKQKELVRTILAKEITFITGPAGTGKSYVGLMTALKLLRDKDRGYQKIVLIYPVELCQEENLGYLKGTLEDKLEPYTETDLYTMEKILGKEGPEIVKRLREEGYIEVRTAAFLRGATIDNSIVVVSEAQNFGRETFLKILSRIGENSKYIFNADEAQLDATSLKKGRQSSGLRYAIDRLTKLPEIGHIEFGLGDVVRNPLISKILELWDPERYGNNGTENTGEI